MKIFVFGYLDKNAKNSVKLFFEDYSKFDISSCSKTESNTQNTSKIEVFVTQNQNLNFNLNKIIVELGYEKKLSTKIISFIQLENLMNTFDSFVFFSSSNNNTTLFDTSIIRLIRKRQKLIKNYSYYFCII